ncbi:MAG TPA: hypothetical protein VJZ71_17455 [Phycisphaerae bacterium]|nr:hypothetical protein [Phycisphaerae bacterium]
MADDPQMIRAFLNQFDVARIVQKILEMITVELAKSYVDAPGCQKQIPSTNESPAVAPEAQHDGPASLCYDGEALLRALVEHRLGAARDPECAWQSKHLWFKKAMIDRHRQDADTLINELLRGGWIEMRRSGKLGKLRKYRSTAKAEKWLDSIA